MSVNSKSRTWCGIGYLENMRDNWESDIGDILQLPYAYCVHDKDVEKDGSPRKIHIHVIIVFPNTTTWKHALEVFNKLSANGCKAFSTCESVIGIRNQYEYLIHNTESSRKENKHLYDVSDRKTGNNFDIGSYEQLGIKEKNDMAKELCDIIIKQNITNFSDFYKLVISNFEPEYFEIVKSYSGLFERLTKGNYHKCNN